MGAEWRIAKTLCEVSFEFCAQWLNLELLAAFQVQFLASTAADSVAAQRRIEGAKP
jgi:hypothetical protein